MSQSCAREEVEAGLKCLGIDPDIFETVVVLRLLRFNTTLSCAGHIINSREGNTYLYPYVRIGPCETRNTKYGVSFWGMQTSQLHSLLREFYVNSFFSDGLFRLGVYHQEYMSADDPKECFIQLMSQHYWFWDYVNQIPWPWLKAKILMRHRAEMERFTEFLQTKL